MPPVRVSLLPAQARIAGTHVSPTLDYAGDFTVCTLSLVDVNWNNQLSPLTISLLGEESYDGGVTWLHAIGPYDFTPPQVDALGNPPSAGFAAQNDGGGARLIRVTLTLNLAWTGGIDGSIA
jgi:hypothetical protein